MYTSGTLSENLSLKKLMVENLQPVKILDGRGRTSLRREYQNLYHYVQGGNGSAHLTTIRQRDDVH
jgi:hypothetical protein